ncbi:MAG: FAD-dependent oxidoreductase [Bacteroidia bacterium]|nr:FAD-dependent oxidoreductase [Bacteroidia bacterium]
MDKPYCVVGGGLAGTLVAARLVASGRAVHHYHQPLPGEASAVAAGLYNTYTGPELRPTWQATTLVEELYALLEAPWAEAARAHVHRVPLYRPFADARTANAWAATAAGNPALELCHSPQHPGQLYNPLGGLRIHGLGWVDIPAFLAALTATAEASGRYLRREEHFAHPALVPETTTYGSEPYQAVIFCEGIGVNANPLRPFRALQPLKGEILTLAPDPGYGPEVVIGGVYVLPRPSGEVVVGATHDKTSADATPTDAGKQLLLSRLQAVYPKATPVVTAHRAGLRPTTPDRKPLVGPHPRYPRLWFLNGLGTKGLLYSPWCSRLLVAALLGGGGALPPEIDLGRRALREPTA